DRAAFPVRLPQSPASRARSGARGREYLRHSRLLPRPRSRVDRTAYRAALPSSPWAGWQPERESTCSWLSPVGTYLVSMSCWNWVVPMMVIFGPVEKEERSTHAPTLEDSVRNYAFSTSIRTR